MVDEKRKTKIVNFRWKSVCRANTHTHTIHTYIYCRCLSILNFSIVKTYKFFFFFPHIHVYRCNIQLYIFSFHTVVCCIVCFLDGERCSRKLLHLHGLLDCKSRLCASLPHCFILSLPSEVIFCHDSRGHKY